MITATFVRELEGWTGVAKLFRLSEPVEWLHIEEKVRHTQYVIVSSTSAIDQRDETYIFPSNEKGEPLGYTPMAGSRKDTLSVAEVIAAAGWELAS